MSSSVQTYMGVKLSEITTKEVVIYVFNNHGKQSSVEIAKELNLPNYQTVNNVVRRLRENNKLSSNTKSKKDVIINKRYKGVIVGDVISEQDVDYVIANHETKTSSELAEDLGYLNYQPVNTIKMQLKKYGVIELKDVVVKVEKKAKIQTSSNPFENYDGEGKLEARKIICRYLDTTNKKGSNILTLPAKKWIMEKQLLEINKSFKFTAVERDKKTYKKMLNALMLDDDLSDSIISLTNTDVSKVIERSLENDFSSAIMDYCGVIDTAYDDLHKLLHNNLVRRGGIITVTLAQVNRTINNKHCIDNKSNRFIRACNIDPKSASMIATDFLMNELVYGVSERYKIEDKFMYKDSKDNNNKGYGMVLYIIKRIK
jgi:hypothetical protein